MGRKPDRESLAVLVGLAAAMAGCSPQDDGQWRVCTDAQGRRLPDADCRPGNNYGSHAGWVFINRSYSAPPVGQIVATASHSTSGTTYSAPAEGITRGGFGSHGEAGGEGHGAGE
jgi:hypothetical protein